MNLTLLDKTEVGKIYNERMKEDFPPEEIKPLARIYEVMDEGLYKCYGLAEDSIILGYAFLLKIRNTNDYLVDYLAVDKNKRNCGLGTILVHEIENLLKDADSIMVETENPAFSKNEKDKVVRQRRYDFYMRNGLVDTGVLSVCFGVNYRVLEFVCNKCHSEEEITELYKAHYRTLLTKELYEQNIFV